nr:AIPR family protein [uncultured Lachnoclostridium sp.]
MEDGGKRSMGLIEYRKDYLENVKTQAAADGESTTTMFTTTVLNDLLDLNVITDFNNCYAVGKYLRKNYRVDAYAYDDYDYSMSLFITDYSGEENIAKVTKTDAKVLFDKLYSFLEGAVQGNLLSKIEISRPVYDLIDQLNSKEYTVRKFRFFILTDREISDKISSFDYGDINGINIEYNIWDMTRLYRVLGQGDTQEHVEIDFCSLTENGLPCLEASDVSNEGIKCLLCVIPGGILADLYDNYGSTLLEGNVRAFLSTRGNVNKNIRKTILEMDGESKNMFFAYNNGISATATDVKVIAKEQGKYITSIKDLQIVNGGQTTASLSNTRFKDKADLADIFVQMKLTVIADKGQAQILIPKISRGSNSQNKVSDADFFSNHEFNIQMQKLSRKIYAPAVNGNQFETHWFFERSRGQYEQEQSRMTRAEKKRYQMQNPKEQKIAKTDFAKYRNTWDEYPYWVSMGAQKNFAKFAKNIVEQWDKECEKFDENYFKNTIVIAIMFKHIDKLVPKQEWYEKGYKANIVAYTLSYFHFLIEKQYPDCELNMKYIWDKQKVPDCIGEEFTRLTKVVFQFITSEERPIKNVTEWCKKDLCWKELIKNECVLDARIAEFLICKNSQEGINDKANTIEQNYSLLQMDVKEKGQLYWEKILKWGKENNLLSEVEKSFLSAATKINYGRIPSEIQCQRILNIEAGLIDNGFSED